jgi:hypothetical protein
LYQAVNNISPFNVLEVINSTPSHPERYYIPVPSTCETPKQAVAWTFNLNEKNYNPVKET